jgi:hypothetical protein
MHPQLKKKLLSQKQKQKRGALEDAQEDSRRVCAYVMGSSHTAAELVDVLEGQFGAGAARQLSEHGANRGNLSGEHEPIEGVIYLRVPSGGGDGLSGDGAHAFFFTTDDGASDGHGASSVSVWWDATSEAEGALLRDLLAQPAPKPKLKSALDALKAPLSQQQAALAPLPAPPTICAAPCPPRHRRRRHRPQVFDRLAVPRHEVRYQLGARSELLPQHDEMIRIQASARPDLLSASACTHRPATQRRACRVPRARGAHRASGPGP